MGMHIEQSVLERFEEEPASSSGGLYSWFHLSHQTKCITHWDSHTGPSSQNRREIALQNDSAEKDEIAFTFIDEVGFPVVDCTPGFTCLIKQSASHMWIPTVGLAARIEVRLHFKLILLKRMR